jgi:hypothetical protein
VFSIPSRGVRNEFFMKTLSVHNSASRGNLRLPATPPNASQHQ